MEEIAQLHPSPKSLSVFVFPWQSAGLSTPYQKCNMSEALKYIRAHQYLYYIKTISVLTDYEYDMWGRNNCPEDYKGGSDCEAHYSDEIKKLAEDIHAGNTPALPY